eukprot:SAG11_NODE_5829_length_1454_cov_1.307011_2_plen_150_part_00
MKRSSPLADEPTFISPPHRLPAPPTTRRPPASPQMTLGELQAEALTEDAAVDEAYDKDSDLREEGLIGRPMRQKYASAISYILAKFMDLNPAVRPPPAVHLRLPRQRRGLQPRPTDCCARRSCAALRALKGGVFRETAWQPCASLRSSG